MKKLEAEATGLYPKQDKSKVRSRVLTTVTGKITVSQVSTSCSLVSNYWRLEQMYFYPSSPLQIP